MLSPALTTWHDGELAVQKLMGLPQRVPVGAVVNGLPEQHRAFHSSKLYFLAVTTIDDDGRPWASVLAAKDGAPGFIDSPSEFSLVISARVWEGDPIARNVLSWSDFESGRILCSGVGLETTTRRRNKFAGTIQKATLADRDLSITMQVDQALGLCPKYINLRELAPFPHRSPRVSHSQWKMATASPLPPAVIDFIHSADTAYLATYFRPTPHDARQTPHANTNHRGGRAGFVRVRPTDGRTLVLPNFAGNRTMNSLGNIWGNPKASLVFPKFSTGSILYVTGDARSVFGPEASAIMPGVESLTLITTTGFSLVEQALPLREVSPAERSPYCPPIRYLAEETPPKDAIDDVHLVLSSARVHNPSLVTLSFRASEPLFERIKPSGNVVLDVSEFVRVRSRALLKWADDERVNDDCVRTWTVSIPPTKEEPSVFSITIRNVPGGLVTPRLHAVAQQAAPVGSRAFDISPLAIRVRLRGIGGDLPVPDAVAACDGGQKLLWIAGGIGITPFLGLTRHVAGFVARGYGLWDVVLVVSTREPQVILDLLADSLVELKGLDHPPDLSYTIHLFHPADVAGPPGISPLPAWAQLHMHDGRLGGAGRNIFEVVGAATRDPHICGPLPFVTTSMELMERSGVAPERVKRERFTY